MQFTSSSALRVAGQPRPLSSLPGPTRGLTAGRPHPQVCTAQVGLARAWEGKHWGAAWPWWALGQGVWRGVPSFLLPIPSLGTTCSGEPLLGQGLLGLRCTVGIPFSQCQPGEEPGVGRASRE